MTTEKNVFVYCKLRNAVAMVNAISKSLFWKSWRIIWTVIMLSTKNWSHPKRLKHCNRKDLSAVNKMLVLLLFTLNYKTAIIKLHKTRNKLSKGRLFQKSTHGLLFVLSSFVFMKQIYQQFGINRKVLTSRIWILEWILVLSQVKQVYSLGKCSNFFWFNLYRNQFYVI